MLLHIVDAGSSNRDEQIAEVNKVLKEIGADSVPQILVLNKIDLMNLSAGVAGYGRDECGRIAQIRLSAKTGEGLEFIKLALSEAIQEHIVQRCEDPSEIGSVISGYAA
jgi:GTP-binding protein HflX